MRFSPQIVKTYVVTENNSPGAILHVGGVVSSQSRFHLVILPKNLKIAVFVLFLGK